MVINACSLVNIPSRMRGQSNHVCRFKRRRILATQMHCFDFPIAPTEGATTRADGVMGMFRRDRGLDRGGALMVVGLTRSSGTLIGY